MFNLDPAAERFEYEPTIDIRDLINLEDVMEELEFGPNGGLIYCFECALAFRPFAELMAGIFSITSTGWTTN